jgi:tRNA(fMet)-specific endonuclease VapC
MSKPTLALDTTAAIAWLRAEAGIPERLARETGVLLPVIVLGELLFGAEASANAARNIARVKELAALCELALVDDAVAGVYGRLRRQLTSSGALIPSNDLWIAATAIDRGVPLLCRDRHFNGVPSLRDIQF